MSKLVGLFILLVVLTTSQVCSAALVQKEKVFAFYSASPTSLSDLETNIQSISVLAPEWFSLDDTHSGAVLGTDSTTNDPTISSLAADNGVALWPVVNEQISDSTLVFTPEYQEQATTAIATEARVHNYAGITLDIEGVGATNGAGLQSFVQGLATALHSQGQELAVYVPRVDANTVTKVNSKYDWTQLSSAADLLLASSYAESWSTPGPVVSDAGYQRMLSYAASISTTKIAPTLGAFGYSWSTGASSPTTVPLSNASLSGATRQDGEAVVTTDSSTSWFEDGTSLDDRVNTAQADGFQWVALFQLGWEPQEFWTNLDTAPLLAVPNLPGSQQPVISPPPAITPPSTGPEPGSTSVTASAGCKAARSLVARQKTKVKRRHGRKRTVAEKRLRRFEARENKDCASKALTSR